MPYAIPQKQQSFVALQVAEQAAIMVIQIMSAVPANMRSYQDQAIRASGSVVCNLAEGSGRTGRERKRYWQIAHASAKEVQAIVRVAVGSGAVGQVRGHELLTLLDRLGALTYGLWRGRR